MPAGSTETQQDQVALAEAVRLSALGVRGVVAISSGKGYIEATYGRNVEVLGVSISMQGGQVSADVHLVVAETPIPALATRVRKAIRKTIRQYADLPVGPINLYIDDMEVGDPPLETAL